MLSPSNPRPRATALLVSALAAGLLATAPADAAKRAPRVTPGSTYLALGDSVSFGYQEPQVVPAPDYQKASTFQGFPEHLASRLRLKLSNAACPGETSGSLLDAKAQSNGCENRAAGSTAPVYRTSFPLHVRYSGSQIDYA